MASRAVSLGVTAGLAVAGFLGNLYIILCLILARNREGRERVTRAVNLTVGTVSALHACTCATTLFWYIWSTDFACRNPTMAVTNVYVSMSFISSMVCIMSLLFVLYWSRLVPIRRGVLMRMKQKFFDAVHWLIMGSLVLCFSISAFYFDLDFCTHNSTNDTASFPLYFHFTPRDHVYLAVWVSLLVLLPFGIMLFCSISVLLQLCRHMKRLRGDACSIGRQPDRERRAARLLLHQLLLYSLFVALLFITLVCQVARVSSNLWEWSAGIPCLYCTCTSINLILRNGQLRNTSASLFHTLKTHRLWRRSADLILT